MRKSSNLNKAMVARNDEFYTRLQDIERELCNYKQHFKGKTVYLNCDDPTKSMFWVFFYLKFKDLGLKKLVSTHYETDKPTYKLEVRDDMGIERFTIDDMQYERTDLKQNGDFRSRESIEMLKEADIVVTNPPFSLFREYIAQLVEYDKKFLVVGSMNAIPYKEIFPLIKGGKVWLGLSMLKEFIQPDGEAKKFGNVCWYTNLEHNRKKEEFKADRVYKGNEELYQKYDNYKAIEVSRVVDIPKDYKGVMGVPISFMMKYNPEQFEILGMSENGLAMDEYKLPHFKGHHRPILKGKEKYVRLFIRWK